MEQAQPLDPQNRNDSTPANVNRLVDEITLSDTALPTVIDGADPRSILYLKPEWSVRWIQSEDALKEAVVEMLKEPVISLDTETYDWQIGKEKLALIQIGLPTKEQVLLIDPLVISDLSELESVLSSESILKVIQSASFEERQFKRYKIKINNIADTCTMAAQLRPDLPHHTLRASCRVFLGVEINKEEQTSDWSVRPLPQNQLEYAVLDAEIAYKLWRELDLIEAKARINPAHSIEELLTDLLETTKTRLKLQEKVEPELSALLLREKRLNETLKSKLIEGEKPYEGEIGKCNLNSSKRSELDPEKLKKVFPQFSDQALTTVVDKAVLEKLLDDNGFAKKDIEKIATIIGYSYRLTIELKELQ